METQTKVFSVIAAILFLISGYAIVGDIDLEPTHYCEEREIKAFCYSLSSTMKTCYTQMNKTGGKRCDVWKEIGNVEIPIIEPNITHHNSKQIRCDQEVCVPI